MIRNLKTVATSIIATTAVAGALVAAWPAHSQQRQACMPFDKLSDSLAEKYHEQPTSIGLVNETTIVHVFASPDGRTWTLVSVTADGRACIMASGVYWSQEKLPLSGDMI
ncbi:hypothetical protein [Chelativorans xinjiangense]|uniref:hypothetical protein n=1 Tax=Chelativorans xinjiangense TaxID=2681485 RepID=UPI00135B47F7|nr:hypothetical protein [Chelativorans xinjiangense]